MSTWEHSSPRELAPPTREIRNAFEEEVAALGGELRDAFDDGTRLFLRAVLPSAADVRPGDTVRGGVALRTAGPDVLVHPYTFRQVCTNGAIRAHATGTLRIERVGPTFPGLAVVEAAAALAAVHDAIRMCASSDEFLLGIHEMRSAAEVDADHVLTLLPLLTQLGQVHGGLVLQQISERFRSRPDPDRSAYGLMNAVTSVARDTTDPELRWRLEELGGGVPVRRPPRPTAAPDARALVEA